MKQVVVVVMLLCPVLALAQSRGDMVVISDAWKSTTPKVSATKKEKKQKVNIKKTLKKAVKENIAKKEEEKKKKELELQKRKEIFKAVFLGGKLPCETEEQYKARLEQQASMQGQPTK